MAVYRSVHLSFWTDSKVADDFSVSERYFYLYLITNPHTKLCGCYEISKKQMEIESGYDSKTIDKLIKRLSVDHKVILYDFETKEMLIINWFKYNWTTSQKLLSAVEKELRTIKNQTFKEYVYNKLNGEECGDIFENYSFDFGNPKPNINGGNNKKYPDDFENLWSVYPRKKDKGMAYKQYMARLNSGFSEEELITAVKRYASECKKQKTEERYIKHCSTFLGPNTPFVDYLKEESDDTGRKVEVSKGYIQKFIEAGGRVDFGGF